MDMKVPAKMYSTLRSIVIAFVVILVPPTSFGVESQKGHGFTITLAESGEIILSDEHVASYEWDNHRILLTTSGVERWQSFVKFNASFDPPIRQLGKLYRKEFSFTIDGAEMYRGHFSSIVSSLLRHGVELFETLGVTVDAVWITFTLLEGETTADPRSRPEIESYFAKQGKLVKSE